MRLRHSPQVTEEIAQGVRQLADLLYKQTNHVDTMLAICREPGFALDHAYVHIHLRGLGYEHLGVTALLDDILAEDRVAGQGRTTHRELERRWLEKIWRREADAADLYRIVARSVLGAPIDSLCSSIEDLYAFTHIVLFATDLGRRPVRLPRPRNEVAADAEAGLAAALDADNHDLAAELLWTWPMLGMAWSPVAVFAWHVVTEAQAAHGFLPGPHFNVAEADALESKAREDYILRTSYHAGLVMGILCAAALRVPHRLPSLTRSATAAQSPGVVSTATIRPRTHLAQWEREYAHVGRAHHKALTSFVMTVGLRRARDANDFVALREGIHVALQEGLVAAPATRHAAQLLRRVTLVASHTDSSVHAQVSTR